jgi:SAM-dependent methyltransferase
MDFEDVLSVRHPPIQAGALLQTGLRRDSCRYRDLILPGDSCNYESRIFLEKNSIKGFQTSRKCLPTLRALDVHCRTAVEEGYRAWDAEAASGLEVRLVLPSHGMLHGHEPGDGVGPIVDRQTLDYYQANAEEVASRYEAASGGVSTLFPFVFKPGQRVLEMGAGSGRDAAALLQLGVDVLAVEPADAMRGRAAALHPELAARLLAGELPDSLPAKADGPFDGILLCAVLMHIPENELFDTALALRERLKDGGSLLLSTAVQRDDLPPNADRDAAGRLMLIRPASRVRLLFERLGFQLMSEWATSDAAGRAGVLWSTMHFTYSRTTSRAMDRIESILNADRKVATYKLALVRALCDIALTSYACARWEPDGQVSVPVAELARRWVLYYWPLVASRGFVPQIGGEEHGAHPIAFRSSLGELAGHYSRQGGLKAFARDLEGRCLGAGAQKLYDKTISVVSRTIVVGPVTYAGGARGVREFEYDPAARRVHVPADLWRELTLMGHWIRDAVILRWADMTVRLTGNALGRGAVLDLLMQPLDPARSDQDVRAFYARRRDTEGLRCIWTGTGLTGDFEVDHAIPFALWQDSSLWNLFPAATRVNNTKRDMLPGRDLLAKRSGDIVDTWRDLSAAFGKRFAWQAASLSEELLAKSARPHAAEPALAQGWEEILLSSFVQAIEYTAAVRGAGRWEP